MLNSSAICVTAIGPTPWWTATYCIAIPVVHALGEAEHQALLNLSPLSVHLPSPNGDHFGRQL